jgi:formimidoylglutamate deiminase
MQTVHAKSALLEQSWCSNVRIGIEAGVIRGIEKNVDPDPADRQLGVVLPGVPNAHSHAFQRALAGRTEYVVGSNDDFWTWRKAMYAVSERLDPEQLLAIAELAYMEMLEAGYTSVAEFHYLHHRSNGDSYDPVARLAEIHREAARNTGIRLTMIPTLYIGRTFGDRTLTPEQQRFGNSVDSFIGLMDEIRNNDAGKGIGIGLHSLRAVPQDAIETVTEYARTEIPSASIHVHIAEQQREVDDCIAFTGQRPVEWLFDHCDIDRRWCLVHATHVTPNELAAIAHREATVVLCPTTEANLGDGIFRFPEFISRGGQFAIGSDSHITIDPFQELQCLEYGQRLSRQARNVAATQSQPHSGASLFLSSLAGGRAAVGQDCGRIAEGCCADLIFVNTGDSRLSGLSEDELLDAMVFAAPRNPVEAVMVAGEWRVSDGRHACRNEISATFSGAIATLFPKS